MMWHIDFQSNFGQIWFKFMHPGYHQDKTVNCNLLQLQTPIMLEDRDAFMIKCRIFVFFFTTK